MLVMVITVLLAVVLLVMLFFVFIAHDLVQVRVIDSGLLVLFRTFYLSSRKSKTYESTSWIDKAADGEVLLVRLVYLQFPILFCV